MSQYIKSCTGWEELREVGSHGQGARMHACMHGELGVDAGHMHACMHGILVYAHRSEACNMAWELGTSMAWEKAARHFQHARSNMILIMERQFLAA